MLWCNNRFFIDRYLPGNKLVRRIRHIVLWNNESKSWAIITHHQYPYMYL